MLWMKELSLILYLATMSLSSAEEVVTEKEGVLKRFEREIKTTVYHVFGDLDSVFKRLFDLSMFNAVQPNGIDETSLFSGNTRLKRDSSIFDVKTERSGDMNERATTTGSTHRWEVESYGGVTIKPEFKNGWDARPKKRSIRSKRNPDSEELIIENEHPYIVSIHSKLDKSYIQTGVVLSHTVVGTPVKTLHDREGNPYKATDLIVITHTPDGRADMEFPVTQMMFNPGHSVEPLLDGRSSSHSPMALLGLRGFLDHVIASDLTETSRRFSSSVLPKNCRVLGWRKVEENDEYNAFTDETETPTTSHRLELKSSHLLLSKPTKCAAHLQSFNVSKELCSVRKTRTTDWYDEGDGVLVCSGKLEGFVAPKAESRDAKSSVTLFSRVIDNADPDRMTASLFHMIGSREAAACSARMRWGPHLAAPTPLLIISLAAIVFL